MPDKTGRGGRWSGRRFGGAMRIGAAGLALLGALAVAAPILAPFDPDAQSPDIPAARYLPPLTRVEQLRLPNGDRVVATEVRIAGNRVEFRRLGEWHTVTAPAGSVGREVRRHWLGTDRFGRDLLSRILYGGRISLGVGLLAVLLAVTLGTGIGAVAGQAGGWTDVVLMRLVDVGLSLPRLFVILAVAAIFGPSLLLIVVLLGVTGWMETARLVRAQVLSLRDRDFVQAARAVGRPAPAILAFHLLPNTLAPIIVDATLGVGHTILIEAALSYLGLGVPPPTASWGNLVSAGRHVLRDAWWISTFPGLAIVATVLCLNLLGDGMRRAASPRERRGDGTGGGNYGAAVSPPAAAPAGRKRRSNATEIFSGWMRRSSIRISMTRGPSSHRTG